MQSDRRLLLMYSSFWLFGGLLFVSLLIGDSLAPAGRPIIKVSGVDSVSYFAVAHSLVFDGDFDLSNQYSVLQPVREKWNERIPATNRPGSPFPIGYSLLQIPFIAMGHTIDLLVAGTGDGYTRSVFRMYFLGNLFFLCVGLTLLFTLLRLIAYSSGTAPAWADWGSLVAAFIVWPATTLGYYSFAPMPHVAAFMASAGFLLSWWYAKDSRRWQDWLPCGLAAGLLFLCRWQMILFAAMIPALHGLEFLFSGHPRTENPGRFHFLLPAGLVFLLMASIQFIEWKSIYGEYLLVPQGQDFMSFPPRHTLKVLFSSKHGWFTWTPLTALGILGLTVGIRREPWLCFTLLAALIVQVTIVGSLDHSWFNPSSFGIRMLTATVPVVAIGILIALTGRSRVFKFGVLAGAAICSLYTLLFAIQFRLDLIPKDDRLNSQELLVDKLYLHRMLLRHQAWLRAHRALEEDRVEIAADIAQSAVAEWGYDRNLASLLLEVHDRTGDNRRHQEATKALETLLKARLF